MKSLISHQGAFAMLQIELEKGEIIKAESGAMVSMNTTIDITGNLEGGFWSSIGRALSGETIFFQKLVASRGYGTVILAPASIGDIAKIKISEHESYIVQKGGFLASSDSVEVSTTIQGITKGLFSGEGFFLLLVSGRGDLFVNSFGGIQEIDIPEGEELIVDNSHLVAWSSNMNYKIEKASSSGWFSSATSGEMLVSRFKGPGKVFIQTRNPNEFLKWFNALVTNK
jgi:uncharacterized protein (TIGR00266 family)